MAGGLRKGIVEHFSKFPYWRIPCSYEWVHVLTLLHCVSEYKGVQVLLPQNSSKTQSNYCKTLFEKWLILPSVRICYFVSCSLSLVGVKCSPGQHLLWFINVNKLQRQEGDSKMHCDKLNWNKKNKKKTHECTKHFWYSSVLFILLFKPDAERFDTQRYSDFPPTCLLAFVLSHFQPGESRLKGQLDCHLLAGV